MIRRIAIVVLFCILWPVAARAALTASEQAQIQSFIREGVAAKAARVRALVARPDLTPEEIAAPLRGGFTGVPFDDRRERFASALLFGPGSEAARNDLVGPVVEALLGRAGVLMDRVPIKPGARWTDRADGAAREILAIHRFVTERIANAGNPPAQGHDPAAAIRSDGLEAAARAYQAHLEAYRLWFRESEPLDGERLRIRAQVVLAFIDLSRGVLARHEVSEALGLRGPVRDAWERHGTYLEDGGQASEERLADVVDWLDRMPAAARRMSLLLVDKLPACDLGARGERISSRIRLGSRPVPAPADRYWPGEVTPSRPDERLAELALSIAWVAARQALETHGVLAAAASRVAAATESGGPPAYLSHELASLSLSSGEPGSAAPRVLRGASPELLVAYAIRLALVDMPRALELALIRNDSGHPEPLEQLRLALGVLGAGQAETLAVGRVSESGRIQRSELSEVAYDSHGAVSAFSMDGHRYAIGPDESGRLVATVDGEVPVLSALSSFRLQTRAGDAFASPSGLRFERLFGRPEAAAVDDGRFVLVGSKAGFDAVATGRQAARADLSARVVPSGPGGGLIARARPGETSYAGIALLVAEAPRQARLVVIDGRGHAFQLAEPVDLGPAPDGGYRLELEIEGDRVKASVGDRNLEGRLARPLPAGRAGLTALSGGRIDVRQFESSTLGGKKE